MRYFNFNASLQRVLVLYNEWNPINRNDVYLTMMAIGREIGKGTRILFDFHLTDESRDNIT